MKLRKKLNNIPFETFQSHTCLPFVNNKEMVLVYSIIANNVFSTGFELWPYIWGRTDIC